MKNLRPLLCAAIFAVRSEAATKHRHVASTEEIVGAMLNIVQPFIDKLKTDLDASRKRARRGSVLGEYPTPWRVKEMQGISRSHVPAIRKTLALLGAVVAEADKQLRYVWVENPHPDFNVNSAVGKRDDQLICKEEAEEIMALKREAFDRAKATSRVLSFERSGGTFHYSVLAYPILEDSGMVEGIITVAFEGQQEVTARSNLPINANA